MPPRAGPGPTDENSVVWGYHSHISEGDIYAGLYGAIVVYRSGTLSDEEVVTCLFSKFPSSFDISIYSCVL